MSKPFTWRDCPLRQVVSRQPVMTEHRGRLLESIYGHETLECGHVIQTDDTARKRRCFYCYKEHHDPDKPTERSRPADQPGGSDGVLPAEEPPRP